MNSRLLLKQCFTCKNNLDCWHLRGTPIHGRSALGIKPKRLSLAKYLFGRSKKNIKEFEYFSIANAITAINPSFERDENYLHEIVQQVMLVLEGVSGCPDDFWCCPADGVDKDEVPEEERFGYSPIEEVINDVR